MSTSTKAENITGRKAVTDQERKERVSNIIRFCSTRSPSFSGIALWVPNHISPEKGAVAYTNGLSVTYCEMFWDLNFKQQTFVFVHEVMHVALRHIPRAKRISMPTDSHHLLWNLCIDAIINHSLSQMNWMEVPSWTVKFETLLSSQELSVQGAGKWQAEELYFHVLRREDSKPKNSRGLSGLEQYLEGEGFAKYVEAGGRDFRPGSGPDSEKEDISRANDGIEDGKWRSRMQRAAAGDKSGALLRNLLSDIPVSQTPWPQVLRRFLRENCTPVTVENPNRPSRSMLSRKSKIFEPSFQPAKGMRRIGVAVDTSGSIDDETLLTFVSEIEAIQRATGSEVYLVVSDCEVKEEYMVSSMGKTITQRYKEGSLKFSGGGGTAFGPAIDKMNEKKCHVQIYLTDMYGDCGGKKSNGNMIWCSITPDMDPPFGKMVYLNPRHLHG